MKLSRNPDGSRKRNLAIDEGIQPLHRDATKFVGPLGDAIEPPRNPKVYRRAIVKAGDFEALWDFDAQLLARLHNADEEVILNAKNGSRRLGHRFELAKHIRHRRD